jgi:hypothetical protein
MQSIGGLAGQEKAAGTAVSVTSKTTGARTLAKRHGLVGISFWKRCTQ